MPYQDELKDGQTVSVWVGNLDDEDAITGYLGQPFERDFGFLLDVDELPEVSRAPNRAPGQSLRNPQLLQADVRELLEAFTWSEEWIDEAERACREQALTQAKVILAFPNLRYRRELCRNPDAPLRFIGSFAWPGGGAKWEEEIQSRVISPPLPTLRRRSFGDGELFAWQARVHLPAWKGFVTAEELAENPGGFRFGAAPDGDLDLNVEPLNSRQSSFKPTHAQARAFQHLIDNQQALRDAVLDGVFAVYDGWREMYPREVMPELSQAGDLIRLIHPSSVHVLATEVDGFAHIGFGFSCKWDEEHGLGVLTHKGRVIEVGEADTAFSSPPDEG